MDNTANSETAKSNPSDSQDESNGLDDLNKALENSLELINYYSKIMRNLEKDTEEAKVMLDSSKILLETMEMEIGTRIEGPTKLTLNSTD